MLASGVLEARARGELLMEAEVRGDLVHVAMLVGKYEARRHT